MNIQLNTALWIAVAVWVFQAGVFYAGMRTLRDGLTKLEKAHNDNAEAVRGKLESHDKKDDRRFLALVAVLVATAEAEQREVVASLLRNADLD